VCPRASLAEDLEHALLRRRALDDRDRPPDFGQVVRVIPPLVTTDEEVEQAVRLIGESLDSIDA